MKLNIGSGRQFRDGYLNVDLGGGDLRATAMKLPFKDESFDEIFASHVLEHLLDLGAALHEMYRVLRQGGTLIVVAPYGVDKLYDPFHHHPFDLTTMDYFSRQDSSFDAAPLFRVLRKRITDYRIPLRWHLHQYLHLPYLTHEGLDGRLRSRLPLGPRNEVTFWLERL